MNRGAASLVMFVTEQEFMSGAKVLCKDGNGTEFYISYRRNTLTVLEGVTPSTYSITDRSAKNMYTSLLIEFRRSNTGNKK